ncbi:MAG TPA: hypothetical protein VHS78_02655 [Candidatus Elarobacter sp.]|nr:hypothetical protein [Candidatus Elarobacter sp.]
MAAERRRAGEADAAAARVQRRRAVGACARGSVVQRGAALGDRRVGDEPLVRRCAVRREPQVRDEPVGVADREDALEQRTRRNDVGRVVRQIGAGSAGFTRSGGAARERARAVRTIERPGRIRVGVLRDPVGRRGRRLDQHVVAQRAGRVERVRRAVVAREARTEVDDARAAVRDRNRAHVRVLDHDGRHTVAEDVCDERACRGASARRRQRAGGPKPTAGCKANVVDRAWLVRVRDGAEPRQRDRLLPEYRGLAVGDRRSPHRPGHVRHDLAPRGEAGVRCVRRARVPGEEHRHAVLAAVERARRRQHLAGTEAPAGEPEIESSDDDPRVTRGKHEAPQPAKRAPERRRLDGDRVRAPILDDREAPVRPFEDRGVRRARDIACLSDVVDHAKMQPLRAPSQRGRCPARRDEVRERAETCVAGGDRIDRVAAEAARAADGELRLERGRRGERVGPAVVHERDRRDAARLFQCRSVERERAEETARRVEAVELVVRNGRPGHPRSIQPERRVPAVERVRERRLPAERRERVL